jgi:hypothetical protein
MQTMVLEYVQQHLPLSKITQFCRCAYTSTMVRIWVSNDVGWCFDHPEMLVVVGFTTKFHPLSFDNLNRPSQVVNTVKTW